MTDAALRERVFTKEEFLEWNTRQEGRFELLEFHAVELMAGAKRAHRLCVTNLFAALLSSTRAKGCEPTSHDGAVELEPGRICYPDIVVECGDVGDGGELEAVDPRLIVEVLSDSTRFRDQTKRLAGYRGIASVFQVLIVDPRVVFVDVHTRSADGVWTSEIYSSLDAVVPIPAFDAEISMHEIYRRLDPRPYLEVVAG